MSTLPEEFAKGAQSARDAVETLAEAINRLHRDDLAYGNRKERRARDARKRRRNPS